MHEGHRRSGEPLGAGYRRLLPNGGAQRPLYPRLAILIGRDHGVTDASPSLSHPADRYPLNRIPEPIGDFHHQPVVQGGPYVAGLVLTCHGRHAVGILGQGNGAEHGLDRGPPLLGDHPSVAGLTSNCGAQHQPSVGHPVGVGTLFVGNDIGAGGGELEGDGGAGYRPAPGVGYLNHERVVQGLTHPALLPITVKDGDDRGFAVVRQNDPVASPAASKECQGNQQRREGRPL